MNHKAQLFLYLVFACIFYSCHHTLDSDPIPDNKVDPPPPPKGNGLCTIDEILTRPRINTPGDTSMGYTSAILNYHYKYLGVTYFNRNNDKVFSLSGYTYSDKNNDYLTEGMSFSNLKFNFDTVFLKPHSYFNSRNNIPSALYAYLEDDVIDAWYTLDSTKRNFIVINKMDTIARTIEASFWVQFLKDDPNYQPLYPNKMRFCDGKIKVKY
ncbi:MAG: hypothetical protein IPP01_13085 [Saprospiraceae bacterium]|nr:hypothetical protein [Saprospiraceae bacterium]